MQYCFTDGPDLALRPTLYSAGMYLVTRTLHTISDLVSYDDMLYNGLID